MRNMCNSAATLSTVYRMSDNQLQAVYTIFQQENKNQKQNSMKAIS